MSDVRSPLRVRFPFPWESMGDAVTCAGGAETATQLQGIERAWTEGWIDESRLIDQLLSCPESGMLEHPGMGRHPLAGLPSLSILRGRRPLVGVDVLWQAVVRRRLSLSDWRTFALVNRTEIRACPSRTTPDAMGDIFHYLPSPQIGWELKRLCDRCNENVDNSDPVARASGLMAQFFAIHPFRSHNGRAGRLLFQACLAASGLVSRPALPLAPLIYVNADIFVYALRRLQVNGEWSPYLSFISALIARLALIAASRELRSPH